MSEDVLSFDSTVAASIIDEILARDGKSEDSVIVPVKHSRHVLSIHSTAYPDLESFKSAYLAIRRPALCFVRPDELGDVLPWVRDSDDIAIIGEQPELTQWRFDRIARSCGQQLDPLTAVYQRSYLIEALAELCPTASAKQPVSLILVDVDHLKTINDRHGPAEGNDVLKQLGTLIQTLCQMTLVARTRGGEFAVLIESGESDAKQVADVLSRAINETTWSHLPDITASLGVASTEEPCQPSLLLTHADEALFSAKANGRNLVVTYNEIAEISNRVGEDMDVISLENKARVMSERVTSFVTQQSKLIMQNLRREANTDSLTQLFNRRYLDRQLEEEVQRALADSRDLSVALVDVDHFGEVNKRFGWPTGDQVLRTIAKTIQASTRGSDWVGRYGGEELCIVMPGTCLENAMRVCERIRQTIEKLEFTSNHGETFRVTLSIGVVPLDHQGDAPATLLERVSRQTLAAKEGGRNLVVG